MPNFLYVSLAVTAIALPLIAFVRFRDLVMFGMFAGGILVVLARWLAPIALAHTFSGDMAHGDLYEVAARIVAILSNNVVFLFFAIGNTVFSGLLLVVLAPAPRPAIDAGDAEPHN